MQTAIEMARECMKNTPASMQEAVLFVSGKSDHVHTAIESYCKRLLLAMHTMRQAEIDELLAQMRIFVDRVDAGEIRSKHTYAQFKRLIAKHRPDAFAKWADGVID